MVYCSFENMIMFSKKILIKCLQRKKNQLRFTIVNIVISYYKLYNLKMILIIAKFDLKVLIIYYGREKRKLGLKFKSKLPT